MPLHQSQNMLGLMSVSRLTSATVMRRGIDHFRCLLAFVGIKVAQHLRDGAKGRAWLTWSGRKARSRMTRKRRPETTRHESPDGWRPPSSAGGKGFIMRVTNR